METDHQQPGLEWNWHELPDWDGRNGPTCQRCWHAIATWFCETTDKYHCCNCKDKLNKKGV